MHQSRYAFIGAGNMASAIIVSIINLGYIKPSEINIYDPVFEKRENLSRYGVTVLDNGADAVKNADFVFLCVKPQVFTDAAAEINSAITCDQCIVSIMAGKTIETVKSAFDASPCVIRIMPNTPLMLSQGASALCRDDTLDDERFDEIFKLFSSIGSSVSVSEDKISAVTALSGSGPAYFFKFARAILEQSVELGLDYDDALTLLCQTMRGSAEMLEKSGKTPDELITMVTSPKGTTLAANECFDANGFEPTVQKAVRACYDRAQELSKA